MNKVNEDPGNTAPTHSSLAHTCSLTVWVWPKFVNSNKMLLLYTYSFFNLTVLLCMGLIRHLLSLFLLILLLFFFVCEGNGHCHLIEHRNKSHKQQVQLLWPYMYHGVTINKSPLHVTAQRLKSAKPSHGQSTPRRSFR